MTNIYQVIVLVTPVIVSHLIETPPFQCFPEMARKKSYFISQAWVLLKWILTPRELIESCCLELIMTPANSFLRVTAEETKRLSSRQAHWCHWSMSHPRPACGPSKPWEHLHFEWREAGIMLRLFLFSIFCCDKKFDCDKKEVYYLVKCSNCLEKFWLPHWSIIRLWRVSVSKIITS